MVNVLLILVKFSIHKDAFKNTAPIFTSYYRPKEIQRLKLKKYKHAKDLCVLLENKLTGSLSQSVISFLNFYSGIIVF